MLQGTQALRSVCGELLGANKTLSGVKRPSDSKPDTGMRKKSPPAAASATTSEEGQASVRRSCRVRNQSFHNSTYVHFDDTQPLDQGLVTAADDEDDDADWTAEVSPQHQAAIPALRPRPAQPTPWEAGFLQAAQLYPPPADSTAAEAASDPNAAAAEQQTPFLQLYRATVPKDRAMLLAGTVAELDQQLGPHLVEVLGLDRLGSKHRASWQLHEELLFCLAMCDKYRMFKSMRRLFLKSRSAHELNGYYHNVWKTRSTPEADEFLSLREQAASEREMWLFEETVRQRLGAMWDVTQFGEMPVSASGPAPFRQRPARQNAKFAPAALLPLAPTAISMGPGRKGARSSTLPAGRASSPASGAAAAAAAALQAGSYQGRSSMHAAGLPAGAFAGGFTSGSSSSRALRVDMSDPAALAALPALPAAATITPRPGSFVLSSTPGGRLKLEPGVTHLGAPGQPQQQQQQQQARAVPGLQLPLAVQQQQRQRQQQQQTKQPHTWLLLPVQQPGQQQQKQLVRLLPVAQVAAAAARAMQQPAAPTSKTSAAAAGSRRPSAGPSAAAAASSASVKAESASASAGGCNMLPGGLCLPKMPRMPDMPLPHGEDRQALQAWLKALGACRAAMTDYKQQVAQQTDAVLQDAQARIAHAQQQQQRVLECAEVLLQELDQKAAAARMEHTAKKDVQDRQQQQLEPGATAAAAAAGVAAEQSAAQPQQQGGEEVRGKQPQQPQQQQQQGAPAADARPAGSLPAQQQQQQQQPRQGKPGKPGQVDLAAAVEQLLQRSAHKQAAKSSSNNRQRYSVTWCRPSKPLPTPAAATAPASEAQQQQQQQQQQGLSVKNVTAVSKPSLPAAAVPPVAAAASKRGSSNGDVNIT